jgi:ATP-dependent exoDNAse (exonuclease V) alpha subunit
MPPELPNADAARVDEEKIAGSMVKEHDRIVLTADVAEQGLKAGDVGTVVHVHSGRQGLEVEFLALNGETVAVVSLPVSQVRPVRPRELPHARPLAAV